MGTALKDVFYTSLYTTVVAGASPRLAMTSSNQDRSTRRRPDEPIYACPMFFIKGEERGVQADAQYRLADRSKAQAPRINTQMSDAWRGAGRPGGVGGSSR